MVDLIETVEKSLRGPAGCKRAETLLVAVSGGVDSMVLLYALHNLSLAHGWKLVVAHFNHHLRGRSSDADERLVRRVARELRLKFVVGRGQVKAFAKTHGLSIEMAARRLRHGFLAIAARRVKARSIVLAHHADDQVELFFLRLLRGAGSEGLGGMSPVSPSPADPKLRLLRPMLGIPKRALLEFARKHHVVFREDATNAVPDALRNRIRCELLPLLQRRYQPAIGPAVLRAMEILAEESALIAELADDWLHTGEPRPFESLPVALQRRVLLAEFQHLGLPADFETIESLRLHPELAVNLAGDLLVSRAPDGLLQVRSRRDLAFKRSRSTIDLGAASGRADFNGVEIRWRRAAHRSGKIPKPVRGRETFDAAVVGPKILLRTWRPGDRFQPIGLNAAAKLQDLFTNQKIPAAMRRRLLVAETESGKIFWVEGLRIGEAARIRPETRRMLVWEWTRREKYP